MPERVAPAPFVVTFLENVSTFSLHIYILHMPIENVVTFLHGKVCSNTVRRPEHSTAHFVSDVCVTDTEV